MFKKLSKVDFVTPYAKDFLSKANDALNKPVWLNFSDDLALEEIANYIDAGLDMYAMEVTSGAALRLPPFRMSDGRTISTDELEEFYGVLQIANEVDANHTFEQVFLRHKNERGITGIINGIKDPELGVSFLSHLRHFPLEATIIRTEIRHPKINKDWELHDHIMESVYENLSRDLQLSDGTTASVGAEEGPLAIALTDQQISGIVGMWAAADDVLTSAISFAAQGENFEKRDLN